MKNVVYGDKMDIKKSTPNYFFHNWLKIIFFKLFSGWLFTFEYYFETYSNKIINLVLEQLTKNPAWRFLWSEVCWLEKWWEKASQSQKDSFTRFRFFLVFNYTYVLVSFNYLQFGVKPVGIKTLTEMIFLGYKCLLCLNLPLGYERIRLIAVSCID